VYEETNCSRGAVFKKERSIVVSITHKSDISGTGDMQELK
jgi:hypothetical protein